MLHLIATERDGKFYKSDDKEDVSSVAPSPSAGDASSRFVPCPYAIGEIDLANHKRCFYEAKVEKVELRGKEWMSSWVEKAATELVIRELVEHVLEQYRPATISSLKFSKLTLGTVAPKIEGGVYP